jgi:O-antigen/teichoic acid export membrane protein
MLTLSKDAEAPARSYSLFKLVRGSSSRLLSLTLSIAAGFIVMPFTIRTLGPEKYGVWALAGAFVGYYSMLDLGLSAAVFTHMSYALAKGEKREAQRIFSTGLAVFGKIGAVLGFVTLLLAAGVSRYYHGHGPLLATVILIVGIQTSIGFPARVPYGCLNAGTHFDITAWISILTTALRTAGTLVVLTLHGGVIGLAWSTLILTMPGYILAVLAVKWKYPFIKLWKIHKKETDTSRKLIRFGIPVLIGDFADRIRLQTDTITVSWFVGIAAVAHYSIASTLVLYYIDGMLAIIGVITPVLSMQNSRKDFDGLRQSFFAGTRVAICAGGFGAFGMIAWGQAFLQRWMGRSYLDVYPVLVVLVAALLLDVCQSTSVNALSATLNQRYYAVLNISEALANLVLSVALAPRFGMLGVAYGTLIPCFVVRILVQPWVIERRIGIRVVDYLRVSAPTVMRVMACLLLPYLLTRLFLRPTYPSLVTVGLLSTLSFALPVWYFEFHMRGASEIVQRLRKTAGPWQIIRPSPEVD